MLILFTKFHCSCLETEEADCPTTSVTQANTSSTSQLCADSYILYVLQSVCAGYSYQQNPFPRWWHQRWQHNTKTMAILDLIKLTNKKTNLKHVRNTHCYKNTQNEVTMSPTHSPKTAVFCFPIKPLKYDYLKEWWLKVIFDLKWI